MNFEFYKIISQLLEAAIPKAYKAGIASVIKKNKETLLFSDQRDLFEIDYTGVDHIALQNFKVEAFTVAGVLSYELEEKLKELAVDLQNGTHPLARGEKDINKVFIDEAYNIIADYIPVADQPPPGYLQTNLRTAINSSYHAAQYIRLQDDSLRKLYPAYQYLTLKDNRVREEHRKLDDKIFYAEDPIWNRIWPPNGWNCRCYVNPLTVDEFTHDDVQPVARTVDETKQILDDAKIGKYFDRNPGQMRSIWEKWLSSKLTDVDFEKINNELIAFVKAGKITNLKPDIKNIAIDPKLKIKIDSINNIMKNPDEVWGETYNYNSVVNSEVNYIKYSGDNFEVVKVNNNQVYEIKTYPMSRINEFRKGVLML